MVSSISLFRSASRYLFILVLVLAFLALNGAAKDRALLIGIDFYVNAASTPGSTNDVALMESFLISKLNFSPETIHKLTNEKATAQNIEREFQEWLIKETQPGDRVFFHYSGHGTQVEDENNDERDGKDEVLAPYDVTFQNPVYAGQPVIPAANFINDDLISEWLVKLRGRRVVLVFDSCHSGTISRSASNTKSLNSRFLRAKDQPLSRSGGGDVYSPEPKKGRDLTPVKDDFLDGALNGITIITAAKPGQEAFPVLENNRYIGALTYLFVEKQKNGLLPLKTLQNTLNIGINELKKNNLLEAGRNGQFQEPDVETFSKQEINELPIFGNDWKTAPNVALINPLSNIKISIETPQNKNKYRLGELIPFSVTTSAPGYLYVLVFSENNVATCLFPSASTKDKDNRVSEGTHKFPRGDYEFVALEPVGTDVWVALLTDKPVNLGEQENYSWGEVFARLGLPKLQETLSKYVQQRGAGTRPILNEWQAATMVIEVQK